MCPRIAIGAEDGVGDSADRAAGRVSDGAERSLGLVAQAEQPQAQRTRAAGAKERGKVDNAPSRAASRGLPATQPERHILGGLDELHRD